MTSNGTQSQSRRLRPLGLMAFAAVALSGCLDRPVAQTNPETNNVFVKQNPSGGIDKIDILFMIDNSLSMGDKQEVLKAAVPQLLRRLTNPDCVDPKGQTATKQMDTPAADCPTGLQREFAPVKDIHIGIVDSSLGAFGGDTCPTDGPQNEPQNDHAWLLGALPRNSGLGLQPFLSWSAADASAYTSQIDAKIEEFRNFVGSASELGCGNEMGLEAWYRFLVDPKPPVDVTTQNSAANQRGAVDGNIVAQRQAFLRPDSLVAIFMLGDENDCSVRDNTYGWVTMMAGNGFRMWRGSHVCDNNPNDPCCYSCMLDSLASDSCKSQDTTCRQNDTDGRVPAADDDINIRCRSMKKRFGYDFLTPAKRYVNALTKVKICPDSDYGDLDCDCAEAKSKKIACNPGASVDNPLFINLNPKVIPTGPMRTDASAVFLAGVVGVPWQDLAKSQDGDLEYLKASDLAKDPDGKGVRWDMFAPKIDEDYSQAQLTDPLMIESFDPRSGTHPITGEALAAPSSARMANKINGHEWNTAKKDVQFACIFSLDVQLTSSAANATRTCDLTAQCGTDDGSDTYKKCQRKFDGCSCTLSQDASKKEARDPTVSLTPLCQAPDGNYGNKQYYAKAYPGLRYLQVLRGFYENSGNSDNAIVGSICPKDLNYSNQKNSGYGYNPAVKALVDRLKEKLGGTCLPRQLTVQADGTVPCAIVEAIPKTAGDAWSNCTNNGRDIVTPELTSAIKGALSRDKICDGTDLPSCNEFYLCKLKELTPDSSDPAIAAAGNKCLNQVNVEKTTNPPGFCYVDPSIPNHGSLDVVAACPGSEKRIIRIVGTTSDPNQQLAAPAPGKVFIACSGAAYKAPEQATTDTTDSTASP